METTIIVSCAGGNVDYRLSRTPDNTFTVEERHVEITPDGEATYVSWNLLFEFDDSQNAWTWIGNKFGWCDHPVLRHFHNGATHEEETG